MAAWWHPHCLASLQSSALQSTVKAWRTKGIHAALQLFNQAPCRAQSRHGEQKALQRSSLHSGPTRTSTGHAGVAVFLHTWRPLCTCQQDGILGGQIRLSKCMCDPDVDGTALQTVKLMCHCLATCIQTVSLMASILKDTASCSVGILGRCSQGTFRQCMEV